MQQQQLLLIKDVFKLGRKGQVVRVKSGYARNYLIPQGFGIVADAHTLRLQEKLRVEREQQAVVDREESAELARVIEGKVIQVEVKVDHEMNMYGSVSANDIVQLLADHGIHIEKQYVTLAKPIKKVGVHSIALRLKEGVPATFTLHIHPEGGEVVEVNQ